MISSVKPFRFNEGNPVFLQQLLTTSRVGQLGPKEVPVLREEQTIAEAVCAMRAHSHGSAMVCRDGKPTGIFTERDLVRLMAQGKTLNLPLSSVMTVSPRTVTCDDDLMTVIKLLDQGGYRRLPVVDKLGSAVGIIDVKSVMHFLVEHFPKAVYNQAPRALLNAKVREGA